MTLLGNLVWSLLVSSRYFYIAGSGEIISVCVMISKGKQPEFTVGLVGIWRGSGNEKALLDQGRGLGDLLSEGLLC
jgi:hypothetical protein